MSLRWGAPVPPGADASPWSDAQQARARREAQDVLQPLLDLQFSLQERGVEQWAGEEFARVKTLATEGDALYKERKYAEAESLYRATIELERKVHGDGHPVLAIGLNNLAVLLKSLERYEEAEPLYVESLAIQRRMMGNDHPDVAAFLVSSKNSYMTGTTVEVCGGFQRYI